MEVIYIQQEIFYGYFRTGMGSILLRSEIELFLRHVIIQRKIFSYVTRNTI